MENSTTIKPVFWRLLILKFIPFYIGWASVDLIHDLNNHYPIVLSSMLLSALALFLGITTGVLLTRKKYVVEIAEGNISGPGGSIFLKKEIFPVSDLDGSNFTKQSFFEKISGFYSIRSKNGTRIIFMPSIYDKTAKDKIFKVLMQNLPIEQ